MAPNQSHPFSSWCPGGHRAAGGLDGSWVGVHEPLAVVTYRLGDQGGSSENEQGARRPQPPGILGARSIHPPSTVAHHIYRGRGSERKAAASVSVLGTCDGVLQMQPTRAGESDVTWIKAPAKRCGGAHPQADSVTDHLALPYPQFKVQRG